MEHSVYIKEICLIFFFKTTLLGNISSSKKWEYRMLGKNMALEINIPETESQCCHSLTI